MESNDGKIAAILSRTRVVINRGTKDGVEKGDGFLIYSKLGPFFDPDTKEDLGATTEIWGQVNVKTVEERFCVAETGFEIRNSLVERMSIAAMFGTTSEQIKLPVDEGQIQKGLTRIEVGFSAKLVKRALKEKKVEALPSKQTKELPEAVTTPEQVKEGQEEDAENHSNQ